MTVAGPPPLLGTNGGTAGVARAAPAIRLARPAGLGEWSDHRGVHLDSSEILTKPTKLSYVCMNAGWMVFSEPRRDDQWANRALIGDRDHFSRLGRDASHCHDERSVGFRDTGVSSSEQVLSFRQPD